MRQKRFYSYYLSVRISFVAITDYQTIKLMTPSKRSLSFIDPKLLKLRAYKIVSNHPYDSHIMKIAKKRKAMAAEAAAVAAAAKNSIPNSTELQLPSSSTAASATQSPPTTTPSTFDMERTDKSSATTEKMHHSNELSLYDYATENSNEQDLVSDFDFASGSTEIPISTQALINVGGTASTMNYPEQMFTTTSTPKSATKPTTAILIEPTTTETSLLTLVSGKVPSIEAISTSTTPLPAIENSYKHSTLSPADLKADSLLTQPEIIDIDALSVSDDDEASEDDTFSSTTTEENLDSLEIINSRFTTEKETTPAAMTTTWLNNAVARETTPTPATSIAFNPPALDPATATLDDMALSENGITKMIIRKNGNRIIKKVVLIKNPLTAAATAPARTKRKTYRKRAVGDENHIITRPITPSPMPMVGQPFNSPLHQPFPQLPFMRMLRDESSVERSERRKQGLERLMQFMTVFGHVDRYLSKRLRSGVKRLSRLIETDEEVDDTRRRRRYSAFI